MFVVNVKKMDSRVILGVFFVITAAFIRVVPYWKKLKGLRFHRIIMILGADTA